MIKKLPALYAFIGLILILTPAIAFAASTDSAQETGTPIFTNTISPTVVPTLGNKPVVSSERIIYRRFAAAVKRLSLINSRIRNLLLMYDQTNVRIRRLVDQQSNINKSLEQLQRFLTSLNTVSGTLATPSGIANSLSEKPLDMNSAVILLKSVLAQEKTLASEIKKIGTSVKITAPSAITPTKGAN